MQDAASIFLEQSVKALRSEIDPLGAHPFLLFSLIFSSPDEQQNMVAEEGDKLQNWCNALIVVPKYSKFESETNLWLFLSCYMSVNFLLIRYFYLGITSETFVF